MLYPRAIQVARLATHMKLRPLDIICLAPEGGKVQHSLASQGVTLTRIPQSRRTRVLHKLLSPARRSALAENDVNRFWWKRAAQYIISTYRLGPAEVLVTFGQPMADHLAGLAVKRQTGVRWIAHFSDPWADNPFVMDSAARARALVQERQVIAAADRVLFTSEESVNLVMAKYPITWRAKASALPHAFEPALYPDIATPRGPLTLRYVGNFFGARSPTPLYRALNAIRTRMPAFLEGLRVEFVGTERRDMLDDMELDQIPAGTVRFISRVDYNTSLALMRSADLLLNIDAPFEESVFFPSKLADYIGAARPILGITPPGTAARVIGALGGWAADPADPERVIAALIEAVTFVSSRRSEPWGVEAVRTNFEARRVAAMLEKFIETL